MPTTALFTAENLNALPNVEGVTEAEAEMVERVVWGWLSPVLNVTERPDPVTPQLFAWALELGAIYRANPDGLSEYALETEKSKYSSERRNEILVTAGNGGVTPGGALSPTSTFPAARCYPDPVEWP